MTEKENRCREREREREGEGERGGERDREWRREKWVFFNGLRYV